MRSSEAQKRGLGLIAQIDRSEQIDLQYAVVEGQLVERPTTVVDVPPWDLVGTGPHSVAEKVAFCEPILARGAAFFGAFDNERLLGLVVVEALFEPKLAWLAFLHVSRPGRRTGAATALWAAALDEARLAGAESMYVSATPSRSAVGFYLSRGCKLAEPAHPTLYALEPQDIHLVCAV